MRVNLQLKFTITEFQTGKCGIWIDATVAGAFVTNEKDSEVADKVGFALAPDAGLGKCGNWLWAWTLAVPSSSKKSDAAMKFISWATSKEYSSLVASKKGWAKVEIVLAKGKKLHDKREDLKSKDAKRDLDRIKAGKY